MTNQENQTYLLNCWWVSTSPSSLMGNFTSQLPTMFWILKSRNFAGKPNFCTTLAYFLAASRDCSSLRGENKQDVNFSWYFSCFRDRDEAGMVLLIRWRALKFMLLNVIYELCNHLILTLWPTIQIVLVRCSTYWLCNVFFFFFKYS